MATAQEIYSFERLKAANRIYVMMPFRDMLPKALPAPLINAKVIISNFGNHCNEYFVISSKFSLKGIRLIPFRRYPTMDALKGTSKNKRCPVLLRT
jgi:hypothetical protein